MKAFTIYSLKKRFGQLLSPLVYFLRRRGVTPNHVTLFAAMLSLFTGALLLVKVSLLWLLPFVFFVRMALNAIDGVMAKTFHMQSALGLYLNELGDLFSDLFLSLPFLVCISNPFWVVVFMILSLLSEVAGLLAPHIGQERRYDGPMGKSDRAFSLSVLALWITWKGAEGYTISLIFILLSLLLGVTFFNRISKGLKAVS